MISLVWFIAFMSAEGPKVVSVEYPLKFKDETACIEFATTMTPRFNDYARGMFRVGWEADLKVAYQCDAQGKPA